MHIYLIGYMGSGKSTLGKKLARKLGLPFMDMDNTIEHETGLSVAAYFKTHGELEFRKRESELIQKMTQVDQPTVISTGGGSPCFHDNLEKMNASGITVYLRRSAKELSKRINHSKKARPLVDHFNLQELESFVESHLKEREKYYLQSNYILSREEQTLHGLQNLIFQIPQFVSEVEKTVKSDSYNAKKD